MGYRIEDSIQPCLSDVPKFRRFCGWYYVTGVLAKPTSTEHCFWSLKLSDATSDLLVYCHSADMISVISHTNQLIHIEASLDQNYGKAYYKCKLITQANSNEKTNITLSSLPRSVCPKPEALDALIMLANEINIPILKSFLDSVLLQHDVAIRYLNSPASINYHHNYSGGLIEHSVDTAWRLINQAGLRQSDRSLALVAALLHDIGKTKSLTSDLRRTAVGKLVDHDHLTLEICATALSELECKAPIIANQLRHAWTCYSPNARFGFKPQTNIARLLQKADGESARGEKIASPMPEIDEISKKVRRPKAG